VTFPKFIMFWIYFAYNIRQAGLTRLRSHLRQVSEKYQTPSALVAARMLWSHFRYHTSFNDYFYLGLFAREASAAAEYAHTWDMYYFHRAVNDRGHAAHLRDKRLFRKAFSDVTANDWRPTDSSPNLERWLGERSGQLVVAKDPKGAGGHAVRILKVDKHANGRVTLDGQWWKDRCNELRRRGFSMLEDYISQHHVLASLHSTSVNTVRIVTYIADRRHVEVWGALLRIGCGTTVDNFDSGGLTAPIDMRSGRINAPAVSKDPFDSKEYSSHPTSGSPILDLQIPFWSECLELARSAAHRIPEVRTVGWDIVITEHGPTLLEGNDNWDKTHFQLGLRQPIGERVRRITWDNP
jgi:hypothetical protein